MRTRHARHPGRSARRPCLEGLESRRLLAVTFQAKFLPNDAVPATFTPNGLLANSVAVGPDGNVWLTIPDEANNIPQGATIGTFNTTTSAFGLTPSPGIAYYGSDASLPSSIVSGPGGDLWCLDVVSIINNVYQGIDSIDPATGIITQFPITTNFGAFPVGLAAGSDGNLWFTDAGNDAIGMFNPTTQAVTEFPMPAAGDQPGQITPGPGGDLFFTVDITGNSIHGIGEIDPTTHAITVTSFANTQSVPVSITAGPDGNVWFNETFGTGTKIGMLDPTTHIISEFAGGGTGGITAGPDGDLWYDGGGNLTEFDPTTHVATSFPLPAGVTVPDGGPTIVSGPGNTLRLLAQNYLVTATIVPADEAAITGIVNQDATGSGTTDDPLNDVVVYIDMGDDGTRDPDDPAVLPDDLGHYVFTGVEPGTYTVRVQASRATSSPSPGATAASR